MSAKQARALAVLASSLVAAGTSFAAAESPLTFSEGAAHAVVIDSNIDARNLNALSRHALESEALDDHGLEDRGHDDHGLGRGDDGQVSAIPEPSTWALLLAGLPAVGWVARRRRPAD